MNDYGYASDLDKVGPTKPLGYLPLSTLETYNQEEPEQVKEKMIAKGLFAVIVSAEESSVSSGALYVADLSALGALLEKNRDTLEAAAWPTEPEAFVRQVIKVKVQAGTPLFDVIADAFADYDNTLRSDHT